MLHKKLLNGNIRSPATLRGLTLPLCVVGPRLLTPMTLSHSSNTHTCSHCWVCLIGNEAVADLKSNSLLSLLPQARVHTHTHTISRVDCTGFSTELTLCNLAIVILLMGVSTCASIYICVCMGERVAWLSEDLEMKWFSWVCVCVFACCSSWTPRCSPVPLFEW